MMAFPNYIFRITIIVQILYFIKLCSSTKVSKFDETDFLLNQLENVDDIPDDVNDFADRYGLRRFSMKNNKINLKVPEDAKLSFKALAKKYGHPSEEHRIVSKDGYITKLFHLPGDKTRPVLMMHGIFDSSDTFIIRGNRSMAIALANAGYDVWLGNMRGNKYSRKHKHLNPDKDRKFWNFSFHEMALYDMPLTIDYIRKYTGQKQISAIAHSQGNCIIFAMASMLPEYNKKINICISLAPAPYLQDLQILLGAIIPVSPFMNHLSKGVGYEEILANRSVVVNLLREVCPAGLAGYLVCAELILFQGVGRDPEELERDFLQIAFYHAPSGTSRKNYNHLTQSANDKRFAQYDYGPIKNLKYYGAAEPPLYNLSAVTIETAIFAGLNDKLIVVKDVKRVCSELNNVIQCKVLKPKKFNHLDFVWARNADKILFPYIFKLLDAKYKRHRKHST